MVESKTPAGTLVAPAHLSLEVASDVSAPRPGFALVAAWDVTPKSKSKEPAKLTFRFDPKAIDPARLTAWSKEPDGSWAMLAAEVDPVAGQATVRAEHYSLYGWYVWSDSEFDLDYYTVRLADGIGKRHPQHGRGDSTYVRFGVLFPKLGGGGPIDRETIELVEESLRRATKVYFDAGYAAPQTTGFFCDVFVMLRAKLSGGDEPFYNAMPTQGHIELPIAAATDPGARASRDARLRHDAAHELFHAVEDQYYSWVAMVAERWWMEAAAEYAASQVVGPGEVGKLNGNWPKMALDATDDDHMYASGHFLRWLAQHHGLSVKALIDATEHSMNARMVESLDKSLDGKLAERLRDFLAWMWFDSDFLASDYAPSDPSTVVASTSAFGQPTPLLAQLRGNGLPVGPDYRETGSLTVPGPYGALLWEIRPQLHGSMSARVLELEVAGGVPPLMEVCLFRVPGDARRPGGITPACMTEGSTKSPWVRVQPTDVVYAMFVNQLAERSVAVRIGDAVDPTRTRRQPIGVGGFALTVPDWLVVAKDSQTALTLSSRVAPSFTSMVAMSLPGASDSQLRESFQQLMRALQQREPAPADRSPRVEVDTIEILGRKASYRRVTSTLTGSWDSKGRHFDPTGKPLLHRPGDPWQSDVEYQALLWSDGDTGLMLVARGLPADRDILRSALLSLTGTPGAPNPCSNGKGFCDANAICTPGTDSSKGGTPAADGSHTCTCRDGYEGDGFNCTAAKPCNQAMLAERIAIFDQRYAQKREWCEKDSDRALACAYAIESGLQADYARSLDASDCREHKGNSATLWRCLGECLARVSICLDERKPADICKAPLAPCRAACRNPKPPQ